MSSPSATDDTGNSSSIAESSMSESSFNGKPAVTSNEESSFMKEEDAAILERGVSDVVHSYPPSPQEKSATSLSQAAHGCLGDGIESLSPINETERAPGLNGDTAAPSTCRVLFNDAVEGSSTNKRISYRRCLSGDVRPYGESFELVEGDGGWIPVLSGDVKGLADHELAAADTDRLHSSKSMDRMLNEAAQFAEAVGEMPPIDKSEVQLIIEDSDDDSGSEVEVNLDDIALMDGLARVTATRDAGMRAPSPRGPADSNDRRLREAKQFAEAVGELPPKSGDDLQEIIDSAGSSDDEDASSAEGVVVDSSVATDLQDAIPEEYSSKSRPRWPFKQAIETTDSYLHKLPGGVTTQDFVYQGICSNPPEITKRGIQRGNYAQLHRKAWLEVSDKYHRYGKNLRLYYRHWERLGFPSSSFFDWLDSKGESAGEPLPNLTECPRSQLDSDTVLYVANPEVTARYMLDIVPDDSGKGHLIDVDGDPVQTGSEGWIFVVRDNALYGNQKITSISGHSKQRFHHSSFFGGKAVAAAGIIITDDDGYITRQYPHSGHYRPGEADIQRMLFYLHDKGVDLRSFDFDTQQIFHVARNETKADGTTKEKKKKVDSLHLTPAFDVACFLAHKARFIEKEIFAQIHQIRQAHATNVSEALELVDEGGYWRHVRLDFADSGLDLLPSS